LGKTGSAVGSSLRRLAGVPAISKKTKRRVRMLVKGDERTTLLKLLPQASVGVEVGVWKGDLSALLLQRVRPARLFLVDPWAFDPNYADSLFGGGSAKSQADMDAICQQVRARFTAEITQGVVSIQRSTSVEAAGSMADESVDWVYIDGNHTYEFVLEDLRSWYPKVRPGGLVTGDDYGRPGTWWGDGVTKAVTEFVGTEPVVVETIHNHQFALRKAK
jgi:Methyltransferase domain